MNVVWSSDENYAQHLAVSMLSLLDSHRTTARLHCHIISNNITEASRRELDRLARDYGRRIHWIDFAPYRHRLRLDMAWPISVSSYARLFLPEMLPESVDRVLYLDCDTVVCGSLEGLFAMDLKGAWVGGVRDFIPEGFKRSVGLAPDSVYINAGVLLIDLEKWRREKVLERFLGCIDKHGGRVYHHDQGVINDCLQGRMHVLPPRYNAMTPLFTLPYPAVQAIWGDYYTQAERTEALAEPAVLHFTPGFTGQVWDVKCSHPLRNRYLCLLEQTAWSGCVTDRKIPLKQRIVNWLALEVPEVYARLLRR